MSRLVLTKTATPSTPATNKSAVFIDTNDRRTKQIDDTGVICTLNNDGLQDENLLYNGGLAIQQRVAIASTAVPSASTTTRAGQVADRWAVTTGNTTTVLWQQVNAGTTTETGLLAKFYGRITQNTNAAKFIFSQVLANEDMCHLRGTKVRFSCKLKQFAGSNAVYRLGVLYLTSSGTADTWPAITSNFNGASTDPTWGANLTAITPDASPTAENGTISGAGVNVTSTANWVRSSAVFSVPATALNLCVCVWRDTIGAASDSVGVAELQLTQNPDIVDFVQPHLAVETMRCQRYYSKSFPMTVVPAASVAVATGGYGAAFILGKTGSGTVLGSQIPVQFPQTMFKAPAVTLYTPTASGAVVFRHSGVSPLSQGTTAVAANSTTDRGCYVTATNEATTNGVVGDLVSVHWSAEADFIT